MTHDTLPPRIHVLVKPTGSTCNLNCAYCFYLKKDQLYPGSRFRMSDEILETYISQLIASHRSDTVTVAWQGGEPTLMGVDFYRRSIELQNKYRRPGMTFENTLQTNGTLLNDEWCEFFRENDFLIGISIDGPGHIHDTYRMDKKGGPTFDRVMRGLRLLQKHGVEYTFWLPSTAKMPPIRSMCTGFFVMTSGLPGSSSFRPSSASAGERSLFIRRGPLSRIVPLSPGSGVNS